MGKLRLTMAQALVKFLDNHIWKSMAKSINSSKVFLPSSATATCWGWGQALEQDSGEMRVFQGRNEQGMAHAATGFARQSLRRQIIACTSSVGRAPPT
ncbi:3D-(3,5/4)-trihydroxycyclohexane-1,2-dione hydrolase [Raoultella terrigena]|uniref:3D-(3,5/4)-trihydroxycyclohexane-1,2-dione hydrolase n=1 Tax=Raoultella terrigena TaxID=577 RepID=A0A4U9D796_RAOTE|nr:3D-(3,5/4)-trihydroxycyclohexane-1,2-dione hydrolase [Raoultella terrigena]